MLKARRGDLLLFGIDDENIARLREDKPILIDAEQLGLPGIHIAIFYGKTLREMAAKLIEHGIAPSDEQTAAFLADCDAYDANPAGPKKH